MHPQFLKSPLIIAGPCSAETKEQLLSTAMEVEKIPEVKIFRAGLWKPRTRPGMFEGVGKKGLIWLQKIKEATGLKIATEVATAEHVEHCLNADLDVLWIGARTTVNPFYVQKIADALRGVDVPILVKNPVSPDLNQWIGAIERLLNAGITNLTAVHRGFVPFDNTIYRNYPLWQLPMALRKEMPGLPIICDPSHISGKTSLIPSVVQNAFDLGLDGLMIECHVNPTTALSDKDQQITPKELNQLLGKYRTENNEKKNRSADETIKAFSQSTTITRKAI